MKNMKALFLLDIKLITPYMKWLVLFTGIAFIMGLMNGGAGTMFMISFSLFAGTFTAFNFENTEKSNLNILFATLPTNRKTMLNVRYIYFLAILGLSLIASLGIGLLMDLGFGNSNPFEVYLMMICLTIGVYLFNTGFQTPFFYRFGYMKGRIFLWIPIILIMVIMMWPMLVSAFGVQSTFDVFEIMSRDMTRTNIIAVSVGAIVYVISYLSSRYIYLRKDF